MNRNSDYFFYPYVPIINYDDLLFRLFNKIKMIYIYYK